MALFIFFAPHPLIGPRHFAFFQICLDKRKLCNYNFSYILSLIVFPFTPCRSNQPGVFLDGEHCAKSRRHCRSRARRILAVAAGDADAVVGFVAGIADPSLVRIGRHVSVWIPIALTFECDLERHFNELRSVLWLTGAHSRQPRLGSSCRKSHSLERRIETSLSPGPGTGHRSCNAVVWRALTARWPWRTSSLLTRSDPASCSIVADFAAKSGSLLRYFYCVGSSFLPPLPPSHSLHLDCLKLAICCF